MMDTDVEITTGSGSLSSGSYPVTVASNVAHVKPIQIQPDTDSYALDTNVGSVSTASSVDEDVTWSFENVINIEPIDDSDEDDGYVDVEDVPQYKSVTVNINGVTKNVLVPMEKNQRGSITKTNIPASQSYAPPPKQKPVIIDPPNYKGNQTPIPIAPSRVRQEPIQSGRTNLVGGDNGSAVVSVPDVGSLESINPTNSSSITKISAQLSSSSTSTDSSALKSGIPGFLGSDGKFYIQIDPSQLQLPSSTAQAQIRLNNNLVIQPPTVTVPSSQATSANVAKGPERNMALVINKPHLDSPKPTQSIRIVTNTPESPKPTQSIRIVTNTPDSNKPTQSIPILTNTLDLQKQAQSIRMLVTNTPDSHKPTQSIQIVTNNPQAKGLGTIQGHPITVVNKSLATPFIPKITPRNAITVVPSSASGNNVRVIDPNSPIQTTSHLTDSGKVRFVSANSTTQTYSTSNPNIKLIPQTASNVPQSANIRIISPDQITVGQQSVMKTLFSTSAPTVLSAASGATLAHGSKQVLPQIVKASGLSASNLQINKLICIQNANRIVITQPSSTSSLMTCYTISNSSQVGNKSSETATVVNTLTTPRITTTTGTVKVRPKDWGTIDLCEDDPPETAENPTDDMSGSQFRSVLSRGLIDALKDAAENSIASIKMPEQTAGDNPVEPFVKYPRTTARKSFGKSSRVTAEELQSIREEDFSTDDDEIDVATHPPLKKLRVSLQKLYLGPNTTTIKVHRLNYHLKPKKKRLRHKPWTEVMNRKRKKKTPESELDGSDEQPETKKKNKTVAKDIHETSSQPPPIQNTQSSTDSGRNKAKFLLIKTATGNYLLPVQKDVTPSSVMQSLSSSMNQPPLVSSGSTIPPVIQSIKTSCVQIKKEIAQKGNIVQNSTPQIAVRAGESLLAESVATITATSTSAQTASTTSALQLLAQQVISSSSVNASTSSMPTYTPIVTPLMAAQTILALVPPATTQKQRADATASSSAHTITDTIQVPNVSCPEPTPQPHHNDNVNIIKTEDKYDDRMDGSSMPSEPPVVDKQAPVSSSDRIKQLRERLRQQEELLQQARIQRDESFKALSNLE